MVGVLKGHLTFLLSESPQQSVEENIRGEHMHMHQHLSLANSYDLNLPD
jgi:hypothetical protein